MNFLSNSKESKEKEIVNESGKENASMKVNRIKKETDVISKKTSHKSIIENLISIQGTNIRTQNHLVAIDES